MANTLKSLSAVSVAGAGSSMTLTALLNYHRGSLVMSSFAGSGAVVCQLETQIDSTDVWIAPPGNPQVAIAGNGTFVVPDKWPVPWPALIIRLNVLSWPSTAAGSLTGWIASA
jgi:hypothetical protein